ncbi:dihydrofolate reductase family protein [Tomitella biformata]|uniref:dihydrofolate reductase family protein n=1 Tax=Tomitella biformata TaxID=630403 RepID=UPI0004677EE9|nr:dihydrofolate reductase family protein [Tomitella biformata]
MAGKAFFSVSMSLDGFIAPESPDELMGQQWMGLQQWVFPQRFFRENLKLGDGIESALEQAREAAGEQDVRVPGGGETIAQCLNAGLIDEFHVALSPVLFGSGIRLFEGVEPGRVALDLVRAEPSPRTTHLSYTVYPR